MEAIVEQTTIVDGYTRTGYYRKIPVYRVVKAGHVHGNPAGGVYFYDKAKAEAFAATL